MSQLSFARDLNIMTKRADEFPNLKIDEYPSALSLVVKLYVYSRYIKLDYQSKGTSQHPTSMNEAVRISKCDSKK